MCTVEEKIEELKREIKSANRNGVDKDLIADMEARLESLQHEAQAHPKRSIREIVFEEE
jgi:ribosome-interacting GTPase 1